MRIVRIVETCSAYLFHRVGETFRNLVIQSGLHLSLGDILEGRQYRALYFGLNSHLDYASGILSQLSGNQLQDLLLSREVGRLFARPRIFEALL